MCMYVRVHVFLCFFVCTMGCNSLHNTSSHHIGTHFECAYTSVQVGDEMELQAYSFFAL